MKEKPKVGTEEMTKIANKIARGEKPFYRDNIMEQMFAEVSPEVKFIDAKVEPKNIDELIRDSTQANPMPKSEVRARINDLLKEEYKKGFDAGVLSVGRKGLKNAIDKAYEDLKEER